ncbi:MAG: helix-turn-helix domain-containing protein [Acidobacteria bacterium]|nr:helix-turn-helix domain-containing protein [Acidobacteriota bacterium]
MRNYYKEGRLPAPDVLIKIANVTGVSLNWLLLGRGEMFAGELPPLDLGRLLEGKIGEIVDRRLAAISIPVDELGAIDTLPEFDVESAVRRYHDPQTVLNEWFTYEGRNIPHDYGVVFFRGWGHSPKKKRSLRSAMRNAYSTAPLIDETFFGIPHMIYCCNYRNDLQCNFSPTRLLD